MDGRCVEKSTHPIVTGEEHKRKLTINNPSARVIRKITVDGCLVSKTEEKIRCDFMFEIDEPITQVIYLELKGGHTEKAYKQLIAILKKYKKEHMGYKKECHIVASSSPKLTPKVQQLKLKFLKEHKAELFFNTHSKKITL